VVTHAGRIRSANADMSNDKGSEKLPRRKTKVSCPMLIRAGAPKARPKGVVDGKQINISVLLYIAKEGRSRLGEHGVGSPCERL